MLPPKSERFLASCSSVNVSGPHTSSPCTRLRPPFSPSAMLHDLDLHVVPVLPEGGDDAAVMRHVAEEIGAAFPHAHGGEMRRLQRGDVPLVGREIGNSVEPDFAGRPGLYAGPLDAVVEILGLARRERIDDAGRTAGAAAVDAHDRIVVRHPFLRVDHFPALVEVAGSRGDVGMFFRHALPGARIAVLEGEVLGVGTVGEDDRVLSVFHRAKDIGAQNHAVVHGYGYVPVDPHVVADFGQLLQRRHGALPQIILLAGRLQRCGGRAQGRRKSSVRPRVSGDPGPSAQTLKMSPWIPAYAGMSGVWVSASCA